MAPPNPWGAVPVAPAQLEKPRVLPGRPPQRSSQTGFPSPWAGFCPGGSDSSPCPALACWGVPLLGQQWALDRALWVQLPPFPHW